MFSEVFFGLNDLKCYDLQAASGTRYVDKRERCCPAAALSGSIIRYEFIAERFYPAVRWDFQAGGEVSKCGPGTLALLFDSERGELAHQRHFASAVVEQKSIMKFCPVSQRFCQTRKKFVDPSAGEAGQILVPGLSRH